MDFVFSSDMKNIYRFGIAIILVGIVLLVIPSCQSTYLGRWVAWNFSDIRDYEKFPKRDIENAEPVFNFPVSNKNTLTTISFNYKGKGYQKSVDDFIDQTNTTAFIIIKNDSILYEGYGNGYTRSSINTSFSIAKSITSMLVGIAKDEGNIGDTQDAVTKYLPALLKSDQRLEEVSISNLLMMQSGFYYRDHDLVWGDKPKNYYHPCLRSRALNVKLDEPPGKRWQYMGYNPILCGLVLEKVTQQSVSEYFENKIWKKLGMEFDASWSIDSEEDQMEKMESGVNARAIDFAKLGRLMLHRGNWNGEQIISKSWIDESTSLDGSVKAWEGVHYKNFWWIYPANDNHQESYAATGHLGQFIFISPSEQTIIVRFGKDMGKVDSWIKIFRDLATQVSEKS